MQGSIRHVLDRFSLLNILHVHTSLQSEDYWYYMHVYITYANCIFVTVRPKLDVSIGKIVSCVGRKSLG